MKFPKISFKRPLLISAIPGEKNLVEAQSMQHRDIKPANILVTNGRDGKFIKLGDFGLTTVIDHSARSERVGTEAYMAPEVKSGKAYDIKADIYSLGIIAKELFDIGLTR